MNIPLPDPDLIRQRIRDALHEMPTDSQMAALAAVQRGEVEIEHGPTEDEIWVQIGDLTVVLDRSEVTPDDPPAEVTRGQRT